MLDLETGFYATTKLWAEAQGGQKTFTKSKTRRGLETSVSLLIDNGQPLIEADVCGR